jgi:hypothetical protein
MKNVLVCGLSPVLIHTRAKVLAARGFSTITALGLDELKEALRETDTALVVICSSFPLDQRVLANKLVVQQLPPIQILTVMRGAEPVEGLAGETVPMTAGPVGLVEAAERLTAGLRTDRMMLRKEIQAVTL